MSLAAPTRAVVPKVAATLPMVVLAALLALGGWSTARAQDPDQAGSVVATTEVLGSIVRDLVGDSAEVVVLMAGGANPHTYEPSARDAEHILNADLIVSNGLDLEEGLLPVLEAAAADGATWFEAADHVAILELVSQAETDAGHEEGAEATAELAHSDGGDDPHIWTDPLAMRDVVVALAQSLAEVGIDVGENAGSLTSRLEALDAEVVQILSVVPEDRRKLVTGHRSMGYFADRYGLALIGTVIPSLSTSGEPTARELAQLISDIRDNGVPAVFAEVGTPQSVAQAVADDSGAVLVTLSTSMLPESGTYEDLIRDIATTIATALAD